MLNNLTAQPLERPTLIPASNAAEPTLTLAVLMIFIPMFIWVGSLFVKRHRAIARLNRIEHLEKLWKLSSNKGAI